MAAAGVSSSSYPARHDNETPALGAEAGVFSCPLEQAKTGTPVFDTHGQPILHDGEPIMVRDHESANRAMEVIGRLAGFWIERREVTIHTPDGMSGHIAEVVSLQAVGGGKDGETA